MTKIDSRYKHVPILWGHLELRTYRILAVKTASIRPMDKTLGRSWVPLYLHPEELLRTHGIVLPEAELVDV